MEKEINFDSGIFLLQRDLVMPYLCPLTFSRYNKSVDERKKQLDNTTTFKK